MPRFLLPDSLPDRPALIEAAGGRAVGYTELADRAATAAAAFAAEGRSLTFLTARNDIATVVAYLALVEAGEAVALLDAKLDSALYDDLIARYRPRRLVSSVPPPGRTFTPAAGLPDVFVAVPDEADATPAHPDTALLLSTSGSTGSPKFVRLARSAVEANARQIAQALALDPDDRPITSLPPAYSYGLSVINSHLSVGATIVLSSESVITPAFWAEAAAHGVTSLAGVPYTYQMLRRLDLAALAPPSLRVLTQAGGRLDETLVDWFRRFIEARGGHMYVMYGQTEATARIAVVPAGDLARKLGSAGRALPDGRITVGPDGEVVYAGPNVMQGYAVERADLTAGDELHGVLATGDLGRLDDEGFLYVTGRSKRIAKVFGLRVNLDEIEARVRREGPAAAVGYADRVVVFCEFGDDAALSTLRLALAHEYKIHHRGFDLRRVERLARTANGKIDYRALQDLA